MANQKVQMRLNETDGLQALSLFERSARAQGWDENHIRQVRDEVWAQPDQARLILSKYIDDPDQNLLLG